jgi:prohibitin 2
MVRENLTARAANFNLVLDDVSITHVAFSPEFTHAVEAKQVSQSFSENCRRANLSCGTVGCTTNSSSRCLPCRSGHSRKTGALASSSSSTKPYLTYMLPCTQSIIIRAQGEAKAAELIGESMRNNTGFLELRRLEAAREIAAILATSGNKVMLDSQNLLLNGAFLFSGRRWEHDDDDASDLSGRGRCEELITSQKVILEVSDSQTVNGKDH